MVSTLRLSCDLKKDFYFLSVYYYLRLPVTKIRYNLRARPNKVKEIGSGFFELYEKSQCNRSFSKVFAERR